MSAVGNKRRAVAAHTARSRCKVLPGQYAYYFLANQRQSVGVITKLYVAIFAAFEKSVTVNLAQGQWRN